MAALRAGALRAPVFLGSHLHAKLGAARPPPVVSQDGALVVKSGPMENGLSKL